MKTVFESITLLHFYFALLNIDGLFGERPKIDARFNWSRKGIETVWIHCPERYSIPVVLQGLLSY